MQVNFTRVPNRILTALITLDLTKRQIKIICLVLRLTYGCHVPWAFYEKKYFRAAGLHRSAIGAEPTRNIFLQGISAYNDYVDADPDEKKELLSELLWNFSIQNKIVQDFRFKPTYEAIAKEPKPTNFAMMCPGEDLNLHAFRHQLLKLTCMPFHHLGRIL